MVRLINDTCSPTTVKRLLIFNLLISCNRYSYKLSQMSMFKVDNKNTLSFRLSNLNDRVSINSCINYIHLQYRQRFLQEYFLK